MTKKRLALLLLPVAVLFCSCAAEKTKQPKICESVVFFESGDALAAKVILSAEDKNETEIFSEPDAKALCDAMLSSDGTILYKSTRRVLFDEGLSTAQRKEILTALFSRTEFGLQSTVYDVKGDGTLPTEIDFEKHPMSLCAYYRKIMNSEKTEKGGEKKR